MSATLRLRDYQREAIDALFEAWSGGMRSPAVVLPTGAGKGHPQDTEIVTPDGLRLWGHLRVGDQVYGSAGTPVTVTGVFDRGMLPCYRVSFSDGSSVVTDPDHLWAVRDHKHRRTSMEHRVLSTEDLLREGLRNGRSWRWKIPVSPTRGADQGLLISPYTLGSLLANGHMSNRSGVTLTTPDPEVTDRIRSEHIVTERPVDTGKYCPRYGLTGLNGVLRGLGLMVNSSDKFIPRAYLASGYDQRVSLLQGLMDGDGSSRGGGRRSVLYHTTSQRLADDVAELVCSLGGTASLVHKDRIHPGNGAVYRETVVQILLPPEVEPFHSSRKRRDERPRRQLRPRRSVVSVERVSDQPIRCISVDAEDQLYQVTRHRIVTHNTVIFAALIERFRRKQLGPLDTFKADASVGSRVMVLVHRDELADQAIAKIRAAAPDLSVGKVKAQDNDVHADVMVCSVQTLAVTARRTVLKARESTYGRVGLIITDECHHAAAVSYQKVYEIFPDALHAGFTATLERGDGVGLGSVWEDVVYSRSPLWMMKHGHLVQPRAYREDIGGFDLKGVKRTGGDYQAGDLGRALEESDLAETLPGIWKEHAAGRPTIVFTPTVATAHGVAESFRGAGIPSAVVSGETPREERRTIFEDFRNGRVTALVNCMVLTEGFDAPWASCAIIARPTQSKPLYIQMVGRVLRPWRDKTDAVIINVAGAGGKLATLVDLAPGEITEPKEGEGLLEAEEREQEEAAAEQQAPRPKAGPTRLKEVESLFAASHSAWLSTAGGVMFIGAGEWTYFLWPNRKQPGSWDVLRHQKHGKWYRTVHTALDVEMAMSWAEAEAEDHGSFNVSRTASWRKGKPSDAQLDYAAGLGITADGMDKAQLSDMISYVVESRALDPFIGVV